MNVTSELDISIMVNRNNFYIKSETLLFSE